MNEPAGNRGKFQFDSVGGGKLGYVYDITTIAYDSRYQTGGYNNYAWFFKNGDLNTAYTSSNMYYSSDATIIWGSTGSGSQMIYMMDSWWPFGYMPIVEWRYINPDLAPNVFVGPSVDYAQFQVSGGVVTSASGYTSQTGNTGPLTEIGALTSNYNFRPAANILLRQNGKNFKYLLSVFQVPVRDDVMPDYSAAPVSGQVPLLLNPTTARLALPGRDVTSTNLNHFIFHENKIPAKIMRAGDFALPALGSIDLICPLPLTPLTYMDFMIRRATDAEFWNPPYFDSIASNKSLSFTYEVKSDRITIVNKVNTACVVRCMINADSEQDFTTGGKKVFLRGNDGVRDYVQIKRPGSSDLSPNLNDIMVDTRLAYVPILAQGFLPWSSGFPTVITGSDRFKGERMRTISVVNPSPGLKLFPKQAVVFGKNCQVASVSGYHRVFTDAGGTWTGRSNQYSSWANVRADESAVDFYMAGSNPVGATTSSTVYNRDLSVVGGSDATALGLSYVIFGIPQSL
ncbi:hypothetical protein [Mesorhizobium sp.]|uniref:hypothetical protein n=1 Tax=Mesorhizobium sp. TaxID=1871066 RepID=UPI003BAA77A1